MRPIPTTVHGLFRSEPRYWAPHVAVGVGEVLGRPSASRSGSRSGAGRRASKAVDDVVRGK